MKNIINIILKIFHKLYSKVFGEYKMPLPDKDQNPLSCNNTVYEILAKGKPCMIARYGSTEISAIVNYLGVIDKKWNAWDYIRGYKPEHWWNPNIMNQMREWSGFFPPTENNLEKFVQMMLEDSKQVDVLASWLRGENLLKDYLPCNIKRVNLLAFEPWWGKPAWSRILEGKKVLVVHPFAETIINQYENHRTELFSTPDVLPLFNLRVVKAVQSLGGNNEFKDWFEALEWMKQQMDSEPYDIALIGCGAYGFSLAAHSKRTGHQAIHLAGALQLLFGIKGSRWENPLHGARIFGEGAYPGLFNSFWVYPSESDKPANSEVVEGNCYWKK